MDSGWSSPLVVHVCRNGRGAEPNRLSHPVHESAGRPALVSVSWRGACPDVLGDHWWAGSWYSILATSQSVGGALTPFILQGLVVRCVRAPLGLTSSDASHEGTSLQHKQKRWHHCVALLQGARATQLQHNYNATSMWSTINTASTLTQGIDLVNHCTSSVTTLDVSNGDSYPHPCTSLHPPAYHPLPHCCHALGCWSAWRRPRWTPRCG